MFKYYLLFLFLLSCGDPFGYFYDEIARYGYHIYINPLEKAGAGTLISGSVKSMNFEAPPETCFPYSQNDPLRYYDTSTLPTRTETLTIDSDIKMRFFKALSGSSPSIKAGLKVKEIHSIEFEAKGIHIEAFNSIKLLEYYKNKVSKLCKIFLNNNVNIITQVIKVDRLEFVFLRENKGRIQIDLENVNQYLDFSGDIKWKIEEGTRLIIESPKYIAYRLARITEKDGVITLFKSDSKGLEKWNFYEVAKIGSEYDVSNFSFPVEGY